MTHPLFSLAGRRALITGSSQGIGLALAAGLAEAGATVILNGRDPERLAGAVEALRAQGHGVGMMAFDVTDRAATSQAIDRVETEEGPLDILVNNAGMQHRAPLEEFPEEAFDALMALNLKAVFTVSRAVARHMLPRGRGRIVNIASVQSALARPGIAPYTAAKGAVASLTKGMAADWGPRGLQCNALAPGYFDTPLNAALVADPDFSAWIAKRTPVGRWGRLDELRGACIFLASDAASYVNGQTLYVDGGMTATL